MNRILITLYVLLSMVGALSAMPPMESLFRNPGNKDLAEETSILVLRIKELVASESLDETRFSRENYFDGYYKFVFHQEMNKDLKLFQIGYKSGKVKNAFIQELKEIQSLPKLFKSYHGRGVEQEVFWGLMVSLVLNRSDLISSFLKRTNRDYRANKEMLNNKVKNLYNHYKKYLQTIRDEPLLKGSLVSPLSPTHERAKKKVEKILTSSFFHPPNNLSLVKEGDEFYMIAKLEKVTAKFTNQDFGLVEFKYTDPSGEIWFRAFDYDLFNGSYKMPKNIIFSYFDKAYQIRILSLKRAIYNQRSLGKIKNKWQEAYLKNKEQDKVKPVMMDYRPRFLL